LSAALDDSRDCTRFNLSRHEDTGT
jgi:hypothetical protein